jgi:biotin-dependent carboxylase-like uncharacterized protein
MYTTVQDDGRFFGAHLGIPISGAMDSRSAKIANLILNNEVSDALLECTIIGPTIDFLAPTLISVAGAIIPTFLNNQPIDASNPIHISSGDTLSFGKIEKGCRFYIGIKGGIQSEVVFNSRSACITSQILKRLSNGDQLPYETIEIAENPLVSLKRTLGNTILDVYQGPEYAILKKDNTNELFDSPLLILPQSNRMAYRVQHPLNLIHSYSMLSSGTLPGTIQLTPSGDLIILMRDTQTTGGYPRILQLSESSINDLSQLMPGEYFTLNLIG